MQLVCFDDDRFGVLQGDGIAPIDAALAAVADRAPQ